MRSKRLNRMIQFACTVGVNPYQLWSTARCLPRFVREAKAYRLAAHASPLRVAEWMPMLLDYHAEAGAAQGHYFHQDLWAARLIERRRPEHHIDIGSRIDGFVAHVLTFMPVTVIDIRPLTSSVLGLTFQQGDATDLRGIPDASVQSLSSLHAVEHIGLGRYGDRIDPEGWRQAVGELARILRPGGRLYFSVPIGRERVRFNADRIFRPTTIVAAFSTLRLLSFAAVDDADRFHADADFAAFEKSEYACGLFEFTRE